MSDEQSENTTPPGEGEQPAAVATEAPPVEAPPVRTCSNCSAPLADGQDWCLECGAAQPGRLGGRPGWRAAMSVIGVTSVLVAGAGAAAYAALSDEAQRDSTRAALPTAAPQVTPPPVITAAPESTIETTPVAPQTTPTVPNVTTPGGADDAPLPAPGGSDDDTPITPVTPATPVTPVTPVTPSSPSTPAPTTTTPTTPTTTTPAEPTPVTLPSDAAAKYDPFGRLANVEFDVARAIDGKDATSTEIPVAGDGSVNVGITVSLAKAQDLEAVQLVTKTAGFTVEVYATKEPNIPKDVLDSRWVHVTDQRDADLREELDLEGDRYRHVLLWFTKQPADSKIFVSEIQLLSK